MIIGIDQSKRSTAVVCMDLAGRLVDFLLINPPKELDGEVLISYQWDLIDSFVSAYQKDLKGIALEGLSFNSVGSGKDLLAGIFWAVRLNLYKKFPEIPVGVIPSASWRSAFIDKEKRKKIKELGIKDGLKKATVDELPFEVRVRFENYIRENGIKKEALWDLADAFGIAKYRLSLEN